MSVLEIRDLQVSVKLPDGARKPILAGVNRVRETGETGLLLITHYTRILRYIKPDYVHVFVAGRIVEEGGPELAEKLEAEGYERYLTAA